MRRFKLRTGSRRRPGCKPSPTSMLTTSWRKPLRRFETVGAFARGGPISSQGDSRRMEEDLRSLLTWTMPQSQPFKRPGCGAQLEEVSCDQKRVLQPEDTPEANRLSSIGEANCRGSYRPVPRSLGGRTTVPRKLTIAA